MYNKFRIQHEIEFIGDITHSHSQHIVKICSTQVHNILHNINPTEHPEGIVFYKRRGRYEWWVIIYLESEE